MRVSATLICDPLLTPALTWLDAIRGLRNPPPPTCPLPWPEAWARELQTGPQHVIFDGYGLELCGDGYRPGDVVKLVCSLLPLVDHMILGHFDGARPKLSHGGVLTFPDGSFWLASAAQELRLATMFDNQGDRP